MDDDTISRRMVLTILESMGEQNDSASKPESAEVFGLRKGIRMAIGTAMDRIKRMPGANESPTLMGEPVARNAGMLAVPAFTVDNPCACGAYGGPESHARWCKYGAGVTSVSPTKWGIDRSTGRPILVYENCSVIEGEQAQYVLDLIQRTAGTAAPRKDQGGGDGR